MSFICHIHNYTEYNEEWNVFSAFNPSKCTHLEQLLLLLLLLLLIMMLLKFSELSLHKFYLKPYESYYVAKLS